MNTANGGGILKSLFIGLLFAITASGLLAEPGGVYILTGNEKGIDEIVKEDMERYPELYKGERFSSYLSRFKAENKVGTSSLNPGDPLTFPHTLASLQRQSRSGTRDWDSYRVPADPGKGNVWQLHPLSDDFNYAAAPDNKGPEFTGKWKESFINPWTGPGLTEWTGQHSYVTNGCLAIAAQRKPGTNIVLAGCISSKETLIYPLYVEVCAKLSNQVLASCCWLLSPDSVKEIDILEAYGSDRPGQEYWAYRLHLSYHLFERDTVIRRDYQNDEWYEGSSPWRNKFHRYGVYWRDPYHLEYYIDGKKVRTVSGKENINDPQYPDRKGLDRAMHAIINTEDQDWRSDNGLTPTDDELADTDNNIYWVDWIRFYKPVEAE